MRVGRTPIPALFLFGGHTCGDAHTHTYVHTHTHTHATCSGCDIVYILVAMEARTSKISPTKYTKSDLSKGEVYTLLGIVWHRESMPGMGGLLVVERR